MRIGVNFGSASYIAQIEDVGALDAINDIAGVERVDCLFIGRIDLTLPLAGPTRMTP